MRKFSSRAFLLGRDDTEMCEFVEEALDRFAVALRHELSEAVFLRGSSLLTQAIQSKPCPIGVRRALDHCLVMRFIAAENSSEPVA